MNEVLLSFLFFLPAGIANMLPVFAAKLPGLSSLDYPLDFRKSFAGKRILGNHKTIRGLIVGIVGGMVISLLQYQLYGTVPLVHNTVSFDYTNGHPLLLGFLLSFGALLGDSVKSFFKRRVGIPSGKTWFPFDQIDYITGGLLLSLFVIQLPLSYYIVIVLLYFCLHMLSTTVGYILGIKEAAL